MFNNQPVPYVFCLEYSLNISLEKAWMSLACASYVKEKLKQSYKYMFFEAISSEFTSKQVCIGL